MSDAILIPLRARDGSIRAHAIVDSTDAAWLNQWRWSLCAGYASRKESRSVSDRPHARTLLMHRVLLGLTAGDPREVDHINRDKLDCRRANLRAVTKAQNRQNVPGRSGGTSRHRGVFFEKKSGKWRAQVQVAGHIHILGSFTTEDEAARVATAFRATHMPYSMETAP